MMKTVPTLSDAPETRWYCDEEGRVRNDALGMWLVINAYRDGRVAVILPRSEPHDGHALASFNVTWETTPLPEQAWQDDRPDYELEFKFALADQYPLLPPGIDTKLLFTSALSVSKGNPAIVRIDQDRVYFARVTVQIVPAEEFLGKGL